MSDMQRYEGPAIPRDQGSYVLASDAEAAIAATQADMLAKCIAAVEGLGPDPWNDGSDTRIESVLSVLRTLLERQGV